MISCEIFTLVPRAVAMNSEPCALCRGVVNMFFCHIEGRGRSLRGGFDDLLTTCMECPGTRDGDRGPSRPLGPMHSVTLFQPLATPLLVPVNTSPEKKKICCCKREGKLQRSATALKPLTTEVNNVDYMAQCPLSRGGRYYTACEWSLLEFHV